MPLFINDTLQVEDKNWAGKWDHGNSVQYCLACTESYEGILGWDACDGCKSSIYFPLFGS